MTLLSLISFCRHIIFCLSFQLRSNERRQPIKPLSDFQKRLMGYPLHLLLIELVVESPVQCAPYCSIEFLCFCWQPNHFHIFMIYIPQSLNCMYNNLCPFHTTQDFQCTTSRSRIWFQFQLLLAGKWGARITLTASKQLYCIHVCDSARHGRRSDMQLQEM